MKKRFLLFLATALLITLAGATWVQAAPAKVTGLKQTNAYGTSVNLSWDAVIGTNIYYDIEYSASSTGGFVQANTYDNSSTTWYLSSLSAGQTYYVRVRAKERSGSYSSYTYDYGSYSDTVAVVTTPSASPANLQQTAATTTSITLSWSGASGANEYIVYYYPSDGEYSKRQSKTVTSTSVDLTGLSKNKDYTISVYSARTSGSYTAEGSYDSIYGASVTPTKVSDVAFTNNLLSINVAYFECSKRANADGYQYAIYNSTGKKKLVSGKTTSSSNSIRVESKKLKEDRFYAIKVRAYVNISNGKTVYGSWSKLGYFCGNGATKLKKSTGKLSISWTKVTGATDYVVYVSTSKPSSVSSMTKVKTTKKTSLKLKKFKKKKISKKKTYYVVVISRKKVGKKTYRSLANYSYFT